MRGFVWSLSILFHSKIYPELQKKKSGLGNIFNLLSIFTILKVSTIRCSFLGRKRRLHRTLCKLRNPVFKIVYFGQWKPAAHFASVCRYYTLASSFIFLLCLFQGASIFVQLPKPWIVKFWVYAHICNSFGISYLYQFHKTWKAKNTAALFLCSYFDCFKMYLTLNFIF